MRLMLIAVMMTNLAACSSWNDGPFGYRTPDGDRGIGADEKAARYVGQAMDLEKSGK